MASSCKGAKSSPVIALLSSDEVNALSFGWVLFEVILSCHLQSCFDGFAAAGCEECFCHFAIGGFDKVSCKLFGGICGEEKRMAI